MSRHVTADPVDTSCSGSDSDGHPATAAPPAGRSLHQALTQLIGVDDWRLRLWDGSEHGGADARFVVTLHSRRALDRLLGALPERGFGRAYVEGEIDVEPLARLFDSVQAVPVRQAATALPTLLRAALALGARPDRRPAGAEAHLSGRRHTPSRDAAAIRHHYDLPPTFYRLFLGETMTYSCGYFTDAGADIDSAQHAKLELVCRKLRLRPGERLLDVGCGFGSLVMHAAVHHGVEATGVTLSPAQATWAQRRVAERGLAGRVSIRLADYRDDLGGPYDAIASVGMVEHVGRRRMRRFVQALREALREGGRLLLHGISTWPHDPGASRLIDAFVFPDGELQDVGSMVTALQEARLEVRDVESLREHYMLTIERWLAALSDRRQEAVHLVGEQRARLWHLYLTASAASFRASDVNLHQILAVRADATGRSGLPLTRSDWYTAPIDGEVRDVAR
jgi:cyclopropane-fatty-acyl-phospholipid synthase